MGAHPGPLAPRAGIQTLGIGYTRRGNGPWSGGLGGPLAEGQRRDDGLRLSRGIGGSIGVHSDHRVGHIEVVAGATRHQHGGDPVDLMKLTHAMEEGGDGLAIIGDEPPHSRVSDHEVGGGGVFIDEEHLGPRLHRFDDGGRLRGAARCVLGHEIIGPAAEWQAVDEGPQIDAMNGATVFGSHADGVEVGDTLVATISGDVVIDAPRDPIEHGRFSVVTAPHDQRHPRRNPEPTQSPRVGGVHGHREGVGRVERYAVVEGPIIDAAVPGQAGAVGEKGDEPALGEPVAQGDLVLDGLDPPTEVVNVDGVQGVLEGVVQGAGEKRCGGLTEDAPTLSGQTDGEQHRQAAIGPHLDTGPSQDLLTHGVNAEEAALATPRPAAGASERAGDGAMEIVRRSAPRFSARKRRRRQPHRLGTDGHAESTRRRERITLDVDELVLEGANDIMSSPEVPVGPILSSVALDERVREVVTVHAPSILGPRPSGKALIMMALALALAAGCDAAPTAAADGEGPRCVPLGVCACPSPPCPAETPSFSPPQVVAPSEALPPQVVSQLAHNNLDIIWFEDRLFFAFRTAPSHFASADTVLYVVSTADHQQWRFEGRFTEGVDLREPRLMVHGGQLTMFYARLGTNALDFEPGATRRTRYLGPDAWTAPETVFEAGFIPWRIKHHGGAAYLMGYTGGEHIYSAEEGELQVRWLTSTDGETWTPVVGDGVILRGGVSETDFVFLADASVVTVSRNEAGDEGGFGSRICHAEAGAWGEWRCADDPRKFDSPHVFRQGDNIYLIGRRNLTETGNFDLGGEGALPQRRLANLADYWVQPKRCALWAVDPVALRVTHLLDFPTAGDTCFASTVAVGEHQRLMYDYTSPPEAPDTVWMDGQHGPTQIYRTTLRFPERSDGEGD